MIGILSKRIALRRGFSLTEMAVVLAVVGVVMGGIWNVAGSVNESAKQQKYAELLNLLVNNVRGVYVGIAYMTALDATTQMTYLAQRNALPGDSTMTSGGNTTLVSPFGSFPNPSSAASIHKSIYVCGWVASGQTKCIVPAPASGEAQFFAVESLLPLGSACIKAVMANGNVEAIPGLIGVFINGNKLTLPLKVSTVKTPCETAAIVGSKVALVDFVYRVSP